MKPAILPAALLLAALALPAAAAPPAEFLASPQAGLNTLPFSEAVRAGDFLFLSGQVGNKPGTLELAPGGVEAEAAQTMDNIRAILQRHGASMDDLVKCTVFLADIRDWPAFNVVYRKYFTKHFPARSALAASGLAIGARVEVECLAYQPQSATAAGKTP